MNPEPENEMSDTTATTNDRDAWAYAVREQGYTGTYEQWCEMDADERQEYEDGAAGIPTA